MARALPIVRKSDPACVFLFAVLLVWGSGFLCSRHSLGQEPAEIIRVGERVVLRSREAALRVEGREVARSRWENHIYRVESVANSSLTLKAEDDCIAGTVQASEVVAVSRGIDHFTEQREQLTDVPFANSMRALLWLDQGELDIAMGDADEAVRIASDDYLAHRVRGQIWLRRRKYDQVPGLGDLTETIRLEPRAAGAYTLRGQAWLGKRECDQAIADFSEAIRREPHFAAAYTDRGRAHAAAKRFEEAIADHDHAIKLEPRSSRALEARGDAYVTSKDYTRAIADFDEAIKLDAKSGSAYRSRGQAFFEKKEYDKSCNWRPGTVDSPRSARDSDAPSSSWATCGSAHEKNCDKAFERYSEGDSTRQAEVPWLTSAAPAAGFIGVITRTHLQTRPRRFAWRQRLPSPIERAAGPETSCVSSTRRSPI